MAIVSPTETAALRALTAGPAPQPGPQEVDLYCLNLASCLDLVAPLTSWLSDEELDRASRFHFEHLRQSFVLSHGFLRVVLARYLGVGPADVAFVVGPHGKPAIAGNLGFSLAHCASYAAIAVAGTPFIGVDVEQDRPEIDGLDIAAQFFARTEWESLIGLPHAEARSRFRRLWTCKEAFVKAIGLGLAYPFERFVVDVATDRAARLVRVEAEYGPETMWSLVVQPLSPLCDMAVAVKMAGRPTTRLYVLPRTIDPANPSAAFPRKPATPAR